MGARGATWGSFGAQKCSNFCVISFSHLTVAKYRPIARNFHTEMRPTAIFAAILALLSFLPYFSIQRLLFQLEILCSWGEKLCATYFFFTAVTFT